MELKWQPLNLNLKTTFRIAHGATENRENVIVYLDEGLGEAAVVPYYGYSQEDIFKYLARLEPANWDPYQFYSIIKNLPDGPPAARAAVDIALHDVWGKRIGLPLYKLLGLDPIEIPQTSFTIGMDVPEIMANRAREEN
jgi:L-alanine-DL-glutamate epimerase-like enolase superfamily enzyme